MKPNPFLSSLFACLLAACATQALASEMRLSSLIEERCALCHGREGESASSVYPRLAAQHPEYMKKQLRDFREGRRKSDTMNQMARDLSDADIEGLAEWFGTKPAQARQPGDADLAAIGRYIFLRGNSYSGVAACSTCHGPNGHGTQQLPRIAGQHPNYVEAQLREFNKRERTNDNAVMHSIASRLTELETRAVAVFLGGLK